MNKKVITSLLGIIPLLFVGYYLFQNVSGNTDLMLTYLEETDELTNEYLLLGQQEFEIESEEELETFTSEVLIPALESLIAKSDEYGKTIEKEELIEVHSMQSAALVKHLEAERAWLAGEEDQADMFYEESDRLYTEYEEALNKLAKKWGVEIEWEDGEDQ
ncbi:hypothetical protein H1D32_01890 [Anaerobacillus sp. CMMVII]|uniref:hypothetical protein n=1 Tax=Anaerobacillus sp. CMMVII TaxID=2755588 RepID=UPI0021B82585|nr:hypothetical protein [Anaerobacillus sp. CMMVII]MCT8136612.1 hypothetical protein [Anaerobacillus sp. CMMVII]